MNATQLNRARSLALSGADGVKAEAARCTVDELKNVLEYARTHRGSKTLITTLEREIRRKGHGGAKEHPSPA